MKKTFLEPDWDKLNLSDDFFFGYAMRKPDICKEFLEILLNIKISKIKYIKNQRYIKYSKGSHAVILDIKLQADDKVINVEMQTTNKKDLPLRTRYYQSMLDTKILPKGQTYKSLPKLYTIFICTFDYFKKEKPLYTIYNTVKELDHKKFNDKRCILLYNTRAYKAAITQELKDLLNFVKGGEPASNRVKELASQVSRIKKLNDFKEEYMDYYLKLRENYIDARQEGKKEGLREGLREGKKVGLKEGKKVGLRAGIEKGIAQQKAKDEAILAKKDDQLKFLTEQIQQLQSRLAAFSGNC